MISLIHSLLPRYDVREERFVPDSEAELAGFKDEHGRPLERHNEASYHFRMSRYQDRLVQHIKENPEFIQVCWSLVEVVGSRWVGR